MMDIEYTNEDLRGMEPSLYALELMKVIKLFESGPDFEMVH